MKIKLIICCIGWLVTSHLKAQPPELVIEKVADHWLELHNHFSKPSDVWGNYVLDLTLEALLYHDKYLEDDAYTGIVLELFDKRNIEPEDTINYRTQPFCSINFTLGEITKNDQWYSGFIAESYRLYREAKKSPEGGVLINHQGEHRLLIDYLQEYASRLAKTGFLTNDSLLFSECTQQFLLYEKLLSHQTTGLWSQGRGWCSDTTRLSEGAWSRGHGWLLRGIVTTMQYLPEHYQVQLKPVLQRVSHALLKVQQENGMYHILLNLPSEKSAPDVSGTGMIAYYMALAIKNGWLDSAVFQPSIQSASGSLKEYISADGEILSSSKGPGPLCEQEEYIGYTPEIDEKHGFQGAIYGMLAAILMNK